MANAYFSLFIATGNVFGYATGSLMAGTISCCLLLPLNVPLIVKSAFLIFIVFIAIRTYFSVLVAQEQPLVSRDRSSLVLDF